MQGYRFLTTQVRNIRLAESLPGLATRLRRGVTPSAEEQRLTQIYEKKRLSGLIEELKKF